MIGILSCAFLVMFPLTFEGIIVLVSVEALTLSLALEYMALVIFVLAVFYPCKTLHEIFFEIAFILYGVSPAIHPLALLKRK